MARPKKENNVEEITIQETIQTQNKPKRITQIDRERLVACRSVVYGRLTHISPITKVETIWEDYGDVQWISAGEIVATPKKFLTKPWFVIEDYDELVEFLRLQDMYNNLLPLDDIDLFLKRPFNEIEAMFLAAPMGMKKTFAEKINEMIENETISDLKVINLIDKTLGTGLKEFIK